MINAKFNTRRQAADGDEQSHRMLRGAEKVAALLFAMDHSISGRILKRLEPDELGEVTRSAKDLGAVSMVMLENLVSEFRSSFSNGVDLVGSARQTEQLLNGVLPPDQVNELISGGPAKKSQLLWDSVAARPEKTIIDWLTKENPQITAFVLSKLGAMVSAYVLAAFKSDLRATVAIRMSTMRKVNETSLKVLEGALSESSASQAGTDDHDGAKTMADILNKMEKDQMEDVLTNMAITKPELAASVRKRLFTFDDIARLSLTARSILFEKAPPERVIIALKGTSNELREFALAAMTSRARRMVEQELASAQPSPPREVSGARRVIAELALDLGAKGVIELNPDAEAEGA